MDRARLLDLVASRSYVITLEDEPRSALLSTIASKSILRAAADEVVRSNPHVDYFGSYEIITSTFRNHEFFDPGRSAFLHAARLGFAHPDGSRARFESPLPKELQDAWESLRG